LRKLKGKEDFEVTVNRSMNETLVRSINTSVTTLLALIAVFIFGGGTIRIFSLALIIGITFGTYSSLFVASPLLLIWHNLTRNK
jgi:preprotein translocase subunit SecF